MKEIFSIQIQNYQLLNQGREGVWLDLPATAEQVQAAMGQIGVTQDNPWDYFISGFSSPEGRHLAIPHDMALASGVNELNFLAARLEKLDAYQDFFTALERTSPVPIAFENIEGGAHGYYHLEEKRIAIDEGMSELQNLKTAIHEIAHATLHAIDKDATPEELANRPDRRTREVQAESVAYAVCQHYGLDTSDYSFGYVAGWSSGKELSELKASLETIRATANDLITKIDGHLAQLQQEREARQVEAPSIWNGLDGLINDKPFMPGATPEQQANALMDFAERDGQRLGNEERRLIVDYANVIRDYHKVADLINELCDRISFLRPLSGEKPSELQAKTRKAQQKKPSIRAQLKAAKEGQQQKSPAKEKSQDLEV